MPPGALLIHGFTATPECMTPLVGPLQEAGFIVEAPLLAGHGKTPYDLSKTTHQDWYAGVAESFQNLKQKTDFVCVVGLSLGGLLGLKLSLEFPVARLALLATPVIFTSFLPKRLLPIVGGSFLKEIYRYQPKWAGPAINDPEARKAFRGYTKMPIRALMQILELQKEIQPKLSSITTPTLIIHSLHDNTAPYANMEYLQKNLGSKEIHTVTLERSNHVITVDYEKERVIDEVVGFFKTEIQA